MEKQDIRTEELLHKAASIAIVTLALGLASTALILGAGCASAPPDVAAREAALRREAELRRELEPRLQALADKEGSQPAAAMTEAAFILARLSDEGVAESMLEAEESPGLLAEALRERFYQASTGLSLELSPGGGFLRPGERLELRLTHPSGRVLPLLPLRASWTSGQERVDLRFMTNAEGRAFIALPDDPEFLNTALSLSVSTDFSSLAPAEASLASFDDAAALSRRYLSLDAAGSWFASREARIPGGSFYAGALPQDSRASPRETSRLATVKELVMDAYPVTNGLFAVFLDEEGPGPEGYPEYWDNPDYAQPEQPVVGLSRAEAQRFAAWLSARRGLSLRLPTEEEYERAARGGADLVYPWGDQPPAAGAQAAFLGNGRYEGPAPVGSFQDGKNAYGLYDMAGNVWQWTSSDLAPAEEGPALAIAKGGSWMDGPAELRVSNRRELETGARRVDLGFRLVREVNDE